jgi:hypothetical protein
MVIKYRYQRIPFQGPPKCTQIWDFWFENKPSGNPVSEQKRGCDCTAQRDRGRNLSSRELMTNACFLIVSQLRSVRPEIYPILNFALHHFKTMGLQYYRNFKFAHSA